jgi:DMSO reductase anchor subunit
MNPAFSVIFFTTLAGAGQGLFLALCAMEAGARFHLLPQAGARFYVAGSLVALVLLVAGLVASVFHLGHPERGWRAAAMWRTSWLSREVIVLPAFMAVVALYGGAHYFGREETFVLGAAGVVLCIALFVCTGMIYACLKFLQEWHTPLTLVNYTLLGCASGFTLATALAAVVAKDLAPVLGEAAAVLTLGAMVLRVASLFRNRRLRPKSSLQTAIGVKHPLIVQKAQGFMGGSFNTREFFHGRAPAVIRGVKWTFLVLAFPVPVLLLVWGVAAGSVTVLALAFLLQYAGLIAERWYFFAEANHPQNLYYQSMA